MGCSTVQRRPMWRGTSLHRGHRWDLRAPPYKGVGHTERKGRGAAPSRCSKILPALLWLLSEQTETGLRQKHWPLPLWFWKGVWLFIVPTIPTSFPSVCVLTHTSVFASNVLLTGRIQKCCSQVGELWFRCLNYETGCPDSLFLFCWGLVSLWSSFIFFKFFFFSTAFFKCICRFGFHRSWWWVNNCRW